MEKKIIQKFAVLFEGLDRVTGVWLPDTGRVQTDLKQPTFKEYNAHIQGKNGLGVVPIMDDNKCKFGAIDIDAHGDAEDINLIDLEKKIDKFGLPLAICRSKSGGAHLFTFIKDGAPAKDLQVMLSRWASALGYSGCEVFPKQKFIKPGQNGNWINLPYHNGDDTNRYAIKSGNKLTLTQFIQEAEDNILKDWDIIKKIDKNNSSLEFMVDAPPCLTYIYEHGVAQGERNEVVFNFAIYFKRMRDDWEEAVRSLNFNKEVIKKPLPNKEVNKICESVSKSSVYSYRCSNPPLNNHCDKPTCLKRKFGIRSFGGDYNDFMVGGLKKILSDPPRWLLEVNDESVELTTEELMNYRVLRKVLLEKLSIVIRPSKEEEWLLSLMPKINAKAEIAAPEDASIKGLIMTHLKDYIDSAVRYDSDNELIAGEKKDLTRGVPVVVNEEGKRIVLFRGQDFVNNLKRKKAEEVKGAKLWSILRAGGCDHKKTRAGNTVIQVWTYPFPEQPPESFDNPVDKIKEEF